MSNHETARANSAESANHLLEDSAEWVDALSRNHETLHSNDAVLVASHALLSLLDYELGRIAAALENIAESVDFMSACTGHDDGPTERERMIMYRALEADYVARGDATGIHEMDAALLRFKKLAGL